MANRIFYACHALAVDGSFVAGAQSAAITTSFDLEPVFQLGQLEAVDVLNLSPNVEVTVTRALTDSSGTIFSGSFIDNVGDNDKTVCLGIGDDQEELLTSTSSIHCTGMGISGVTYNFPVDGIFTEEVSFSGTSKTVGGCSVNASEDTTSKALVRYSYQSGVPATVTSAGNLTNISISASISRENLFRLGEYKAYHNFASLPSEITVDFEVSATSVDGIAIAAAAGCSGPTENKENITIALCGYSFAIENARLSNVAYGGGDTGGGNATITFTYTSYNSLTVS